MNQILKKQNNESVNEYCHRICSLKNDLGFTWSDIKDILDEETGLNLTADGYRMKERNYKPDTVDLQVNMFEENNEEYKQYLDDTLLEIKKERFKLSDERIQNNALLRRVSREETLKEIASICAGNMNQTNMLKPYTFKGNNNSEKEGILLVSDWHYGIEIDNYWNVYNPDIAKERITKLRDKTIEYVKKEKLNKLFVLNLGDLIAGRIHLQLRINSRFDVITQIMEVSELLADMLYDISKYVQIDYYDTLDNHSRLEPNVKDSLELESLCRITYWYLKERLSDIENIKIKENKFADDIISFESLGHNIIGVHGHKDKPDKIIDRLSLMTQKHYDLVCAAHLHHFNCEEKNETVLVSNSSLMGTDEYAEKLRLSAKPSQCLIIVSKENAVEQIYKINLD